MKRISMWVVVALFVQLGATVAFAQSLGDVAREQRKKKYEKRAATKVYTDENLPVSNAAKTESPDSKPADCPDCTSGDNAAPDPNTAEKQTVAGKPAPGSVEEYKEKAAEWKKKVDEQKKVVAGLQQQLESLQQQYRLRASAYYADAGLRLRDGGAKWAEDETQFRKAIDDKQKELEAAKQKLADVQEQGHKSGAPNSALE
jgi:hypothetical protein